MVSELEKQARVMSVFDKFEMPKLKEPALVRLRFRKVGNLQYISHLDLQRVFSHILTRSGVPVWYTEGFNPHPKMVFALPLSVGTQSVCEYLDIKIDRKISLDEIVERLNNQVTDELKIEKAYFPVTKFQEIATVEYQISIFDETVTTDTAAKVEELFKNQTLKATKKTKSGEKEIVINDYIKELSAESVDKKLDVTVELAAGEGSLNPEMIVSALREKLLLLADYPNDGYYTITRTHLYFENGREFE